MTMTVGTGRGSLAELGDMGAPFNEQRAREDMVPLRTVSRTVLDAPAPSRTALGRISGILGRLGVKRRTPSFTGLLKWRDPDSNWGHHDFQSC